MPPGHTHLLTDSVALPLGPLCHSPLPNDVDLRTREGGDAHASLEEDGVGVGGVWGEGHRVVGGVKMVLASNQFQDMGDGSTRRGEGRGGEGKRGEENTVILAITDSHCSCHCQQRHSLLG